MNNYIEMEQAYQDFINSLKFKEKEFNKRFGEKEEVPAEWLDFCSKHNAIISKYRKCGANLNILDDFTLQIDYDTNRKIITVSKIAIIYDCTNNKLGCHALGGYNEFDSFQDVDNHLNNLKSKIKKFKALYKEMKLEEDF